MYFVYPPDAMEKQAAWLTLPRFIRRPRKWQSAWLQADQMC